MSRPKRKFLDLTGKRFTRLLVIKRVENSKWGQVRWLCECKCGNLKTVQGRHLKSGNTVSCGCLQKEVAQIHGMCGTPEYIAWINLKSRCCNPKNTAYTNYGGRGIKVYDRWLNSFEAFYKDMGKRPGPEYTIERLATSKNYTPDNCVWATRGVQAGNTRRNRWFKAIAPIGTIYISRNQAEFAREHDLIQSNIYQCLAGSYKQHKGWIFERVVFKSL